MADVADLFQAMSHTQPAQRGEGIRGTGAGRVRFVHNVYISYEWGSNRPGGELEGSDGAGAYCIRLKSSAPMDRNGPCKSRWLGYLVDREVGAIW